VQRLASNYAEQRNKESEDTAEASMSFEDAFRSYLYKYGISRNEMTPNHPTRLLMDMADASNISSSRSKNGLRQGYDYYIDGFTYYRFLMPAPFYAGGGIRPDDVNELSSSYEGSFTFIILNGKKYLVLKNQNYCVLIAEDNSVFFEGLGLFPGFASRSESSYLRVKSPYEVVDCSYDAADLESVGGSPWSAGKKNFGIGAEINIECTNTYAN
jgi:hypothetical protein